MILYVVTDTSKAYRNSLGWYKFKIVLERTSGDACLIVHYRRMSTRLLKTLRPWAICHSGGGTDYAKYDVLRHKGYRQAVFDYPGAQIGFCGGHQILAVFHGGRIGPMRRLRQDEPDLAGYSPGAFKEWGVYPVRIVRRDPLFAGLPNVIRVQENHAWEVKRLGRGLVLLADAPTCRVQAFRHREKPIYGVEFHPEASSEHYPDGLQLLRNFFRIARQEWKAAGRR